MKSSLLPRRLLDELHDLLLCRKAPRLQLTVRHLSVNGHFERLFSSDGAGALCVRHLGEYGALQALIPRGVPSSTTVFDTHDNLRHSAELVLRSLAQNVINYQRLSVHAKQIDCH